MNYDQKERIVEIVFFIALFLCSGALRQVRADDTVSKDPAKHSVQPGDRLDIQVAGEKNLSGIFLSVLNVHVNRVPFGGTIRHIRYQRGGFKNAMKAETSLTNESNALWIDTDHGLCTVRQIAGAIARRIVCAVEEGETLAKGEKFGMIRFGSRTELYLPVTTDVCVTMKQRVKGGETVMGRFR